MSDGLVVRRRAVARAKSAASTETGRRVELPHGMALAPGRCGQIAAKQDRTRCRDQPALPSNIAWPVCQIWQRSGSYLPSPVASPGLLDPSVIPWARSADGHGRATGDRSCDSRTRSHAATAARRAVPMVTRTEDLRSGLSVDSPSFHQCRIQKTAPSGPADDPRFRMALLRERAAGARPAAPAALLCRPGSVPAVRWADLLPTHPRSIPGIVGGMRLSWSPVADSAAEVRFRLPPAVRETAQRPRVHSVRCDHDVIGMDAQYAD